MWAEFYGKMVDFQIQTGLWPEKCIIPKSDYDELMNEIKTVDHLKNDFKTINGNNYLLDVLLEPDTEINDWIIVAPELL